MQERARVCFDFPFPETRVFRYQAMQDILHHLINNPFDGFTRKELATITGSDVSSVSRSVDLLDQLGVIEIKDETPQKVRVRHDHLDRSDPLFAVPQSEFRAPIQEYCGELQERIADAEPIQSLVGVVLFGSVAHGTADRRSDIDLLVIIDGDATQTRRIATKTARDVEERSFDGDRYQFEVLVETPSSAVSHAESLRDVFDEGIVLNRSDDLQNVQRAVYETTVN